MVPGQRQRPIYAVIDVGSKSVRLLVVRRLSQAAFEVVDEERYDSRLGEGQVDGLISREAFERGLLALRIVSQVASGYEPTALIAVGTEALRRARNSAQFVARVYDETGIQVRVLSEQEEAYASYLGTINATRLADGAILDVGGGSLEFMRVAGRHLATARSVPLGAIFATERYLPSDPPTAKEMRALRKAVRQHVGDVLAGAEPLEVLWATGGAVRNLARMARLRTGYPLRRLHGYALRQAELKRILKQLTSVDTAARRRLPGMNTARAGTLPAVAVVVDEVLSLLNLPQLRVSGQGLREGMVWQLMRGSTPLLPDVRAASIAGLALANGVDVALYEGDVRFAGELFEATASIHGYGHLEMGLLVSATRLSEIGMHVDYYNRDRHAEYLVHSGDLHGFGHRETVLLAAIVRYSLGGTPDLGAYRLIMEEGDVRTTTVLAAMLGVTRAVARRPAMPGLVTSIAIVDGTLELAVESQDPIDAEIYALDRPARRLENALGIPVRVAGRALPNRRLAELA
jgi:exopolyphosphatase/guanosine-5'-triphosphate,3'-diphosphate pyrophosphatase